MIRTAYNNRFRDHKDSQARGSQARGQRPGRRDAAQHRDPTSRRESSNVVHPWMSLPDRLAATQAAMRELAGQDAFQCPLGESLAPTPAAPQAESKPRSTGVNIIIRKRRLPAGAIAALANAG
jgi:hypothetical protein